MTQDTAGTLLADLADLILNVGRLVRARTPPDAVALTETERQVMRVVDLFPGASPSEIAERAGLQRSNVSTTLRVLEGKGMLKRSASGRRIEVRPTELAAANLLVLREAWARELKGVVGDDVGQLRACTELLSSIEQALTDSKQTS
jgi:DNA-binding MarR family transcriptional regulator